MCRYSVQPVAFVEVEEWLFSVVAVGADGFAESEAHRVELSSAFLAVEASLQPTTELFRERHTIRVSLFIRGW